MSSCNGGISHLHFFDPVTMPSGHLSGYVSVDKAIRPRVNKIRKISIKQVDTGYIVKVGCKTIAVESAKKLIEVFTKYIEDPNKTEDLYEKGKLFKK